MAHPPALDRAMSMVSDLRARCPWDRVQTRETLRPYLVEEVMELHHALGEGDLERIRDEVSDMLLHLAWQLVLAEERGEFTRDDIAGDLERKMQRRHPHLFNLGPKEPWERLKRRENGRGTLDGLPPGLPTLLMAFRLQERAASVGFDWPDATGPIAKVKEELTELESELARSGPVQETRVLGEVGDLLFSVVNLARKVGVQPDRALEQANRVFRERFAAVERLAGERGLELHTAGLETLDALWDDVKAANRERAE
jgi:nucleoside triphosphate diphosphatase